MTWEIFFMLTLLLGTLIAFTMERVPPELTAITAFGIVLLFGLLPADQALNVFSNPGPITIAAMFIISSALEKGGAIESLAASVQNLPTKNITLILPFLILSVAGVSAFINNTPVVVIFLPVVMSLSHSLRIPPSKLLIPLSFASIFGGLCTLVGSSTNIIISSFAETQGLKGFGMFELSNVGIPLLIFGTIFLTLFAPKILPNRETVSSLLSDEERREYLIESFVPKDSPLIGTLLKNVISNSRSPYRILELNRDGVLFSSDLGEQVLEEGDRLSLAISPRNVTQALSGFKAGNPLKAKNQRQLLNFTFMSGLEQISGSEGLIVEGVLGPNSFLVGKTIASTKFSRRYRLKVIALHRRGENIARNFEHHKLEYGDTFLLLGTREAFKDLRTTEDIVILDNPPVVLSEKRRKLPITLSVIMGVIMIASLGLLPISIAAIIGCIVLFNFRCIQLKEAYESIQWSIVFLIFAMLGIGAAMETTGTSLWLAEKLIWIILNFISEPWRPFALLAGVYLLTTILTEILSNNAAAILLANLSVPLAVSIGMDPRPLLIAISIAASASFATPIGYQTNTYIYSVGGYKFVDFLKIGIPLNMLTFVLAVLIIPKVWGL